jgi:hypothetical protein
MTVDKRYTNGLLARLVRTVAPRPGHVWDLQQGSPTAGRWWRVSECELRTHTLGRDIVSGATGTIARRRTPTRRRGATCVGTRATQRYVGTVGSTCRQLHRTLQET